MLSRNRVGVGGGGGCPITIGPLVADSSPWAAVTVYVPLAENVTVKDDRPPTKNGVAGATVEVPPGVTVMVSGCPSRSFVWFPCESRAWTVTGTAVPMVNGPGAAVTTRWSVGPGLTETVAVAVNVPPGFDGS